MKKLHKTILNLLPICFLFITLGLFYFSTIAPGLTWANNGADGGDFITAAATGGVAHPPGYPFYLTIARLFLLIPIKTFAYRTNLLSLFCTIVSSIYLYKIAIRFSSTSSYKWFIGLSSSLAFGLSQLVWSQAVITEVYALQGLLVILFLFILQFGETQRVFSWKQNLVLGLIFGLALQNHLTAIFFLPFVLLSGIVKRNQENDNRRQSKILSLNNIFQVHINWPSLFIRCIGIFLGLLFTLTIFIRANSNSPINWGDPTTINKFLWLVSGKMYSGFILNFPFNFLVTRIHLWGELFLNQIGLIGIAISIIGFVIKGSESKEKTFSTLWIFLSFFVFSLLYNSIDSYIYIIFSMIAVCIWFGWGIEVLLTRILKNKIILFIFVFLVFGGLIGFGFRTYPKVDASKDSRAEEFGKKVMTEAPQNSIIFTDADKDSFTLWYFQYVLLERPDISIVVSNLMANDWYRNLLISTYPSLVIPDNTNNSWNTGIVELNPDRPYCNTVVIEDAYFSCQK